jgi:WD40 repeat protein
MVYGVALSGDGDIVASGGWDGSVRVFDSAHGQLQHTLHGHTGAVWGVALSGDGRWLASGGVDGTVRLWSLATSQERSRSAHSVHTLAGHTGVIYSVALSDDGRWLASGGVDGTVRVWDPGTGQPVATLHGQPGVVFYSVSLSADGRKLAAGGSDGAVWVWDLAGTAERGGPDQTHDDRSNSTRVAVLQGHDRVVSTVALSTDSQLVVSGGQDSTVRVWDSRSGELLLTLRDHTAQVFGVALSADGRWLASGGADGTLRLYALDGRDQPGGLRGSCVQVLRGDRLYERLDITGLTGISAGQRATLVALGAVDSHSTPAVTSHR